MRAPLAALAVLTALLAPAAAPAAALGASPAEPADPAARASAFVQHSVARGMAILGDPALDTPARTAQFRTFVDEVIDTRAVAGFVLGPYRRTSPPQTVRAFADTFHQYATASYESRMDAYGGQTIEVTGAMARNDRDMLVEGRILQPDGTPLANVAFRILDTARGLQLFDVRVEGIWLAVEQRNQFASYLGRHGGDVGALIAYLQDETAALRARSAARAQAATGTPDNGEEDGRDAGGGGHSADAGNADSGNADAGDADAGGLGGDDTSRVLAAETSPAAAED